MANDLHEVHPSAGDHSMADLLEQYLPGCRLQRGQMVRGMIVRASRQGIVVDVGAKREGAVSVRELEQMDACLLAALKPGDEVSVYVLDPEGPGGEIVLSLARAQQEEGWHRAKALSESKETIELEVVSSNRGGLIVSIGAVRGFVPASQLDHGRRVPRISDPGCSEALADLVGCSLELQVIEVDRERNRLILSERAALSSRRAEGAGRLLDALKEGDVREGRVSNLTHFGAFVDLGGLDGLLHLSEISWQPVGHPSEVLEVGQEVEVMVLNVDRERRQVALSMKRLGPDPWVTVGERYQMGQLVEGRITRLARWGAFACIVGDEAIEGLIHISELDEQRVTHPRDVVRAGQILTLRVVRVEPERHRLALSLKQVTEGEQADADWEAEYVASHESSLESPMTSAFDEALQE